MDDRVGRGSEDGLAHSACVEQIERDRLRPERPYTLVVAGRPEAADDLVTSLDQLRNEPGTDRTACSCDEDSHRVLLCVSGIACHIARISRVYCNDPTRRRNVTDGRARMAGRALRGAPDPPAGGGLPDARLAERGRRRRAGSLATTQPLRRERGREPRRLADDGRRARSALDMLRSRDVRREEPLGVRLPDPIVDRADGTDPEHEALLADSVGLALLVVLETLTPAERLAFVLHDMFAVPFDEIAPIVDRSPAAPRQLASRARRRVRAERTVPDADLTPARGRRGVPRRGARRGLRRAARGARPGRRAAGRLRSAGRSAGGPRGRSSRRSGGGLFAASAYACGRRSSTAPSGLVTMRDGRGPSRSAAFTVRDGRIVEMDWLADAARLRGSTWPRPACSCAPRRARAGLGIIAETGGG